jgi:hypothetical protein
MVTSVFILIIVRPQLSIHAQSICELRFYLVLLESGSIDPNSPNDGLLLKTKHVKTKCW